MEQSDELAQTLNPIPTPSPPSKMGFEAHWEEGPFFHETK
jgi:hypothetical protein